MFKSLSQVGHMIST